MPISSCRIVSIQYDSVLSGGEYLVFNCQCRVFSMYCLVSSFDSSVLSHTPEGSQRPPEASGWAPAYSRRPEPACGGHLEATAESVHFHFQNSGFTQTC